MYDVSNFKISTVVDPQLFDKFERSDIQLWRSYLAYFNDNNREMHTLNSFYHKLGCGIPIEAKLFVVLVPQSNDPDGFVAIYFTGLKYIIIFNVVVVVCSTFLTITQGIQKC
jgi:hypothetical protein